MKFVFTIASLLALCSSTPTLASTRHGDSSLLDTAASRRLAVRELRRLEWDDACANAYQALHENNPIFDDTLWLPAITASEGDLNGENAICDDPWCDVDAHSFIGKAKVDQLIDECFAIDGAFAFKEDYDQDCDDNMFDYKYLNFMDCYPKECDGQVTEEEIDSQNVEYMDEFYNATCTIDVVLVDPQAGTSAAVKPSVLGVTTGFSVAAGMVLVSLFL